LVGDVEAVKVTRAIGVGDASTGADFLSTAAELDTESAVFTTFVAGATWLAKSRGTAATDRWAIAFAGAVVGVTGCTVCAIAVVPATAIAVLVVVVVVVFALVVAFFEAAVLVTVDVANFDVAVTCVDDTA
jgi:hypothetical protein